MSYTTCFTGQLEITPDLEPKHLDELQEFHNRYEQENFYS